MLIAEDWVSFRWRRHVKTRRRGRRVCRARRSCRLRAAGLSHRGRNPGVDRGEEGSVRGGREADMGLRGARVPGGEEPVSYTHLRAHETRHDLVCRLLLEKKKKKTHTKINTPKNKINKTKQHNKRTNTQ